MDNSETLDHLHWSSGEEQTCDEILRTEDGREFRVHEARLSDQSQFFAGLFSNQKEEGGYGIVIHNLDGNTLKEILTYLYTGTIYLNRENMIRILVASDFLLIDALVEKCKSFVIRRIDMDNCLTIVPTAWRIRNLGIFEECYRYAQLHFEEACFKSKDCLANLPKRLLMSFLKDKSLNVRSGKVVWLIIEKWVKKNEEERLLYVPELLTCIYQDEMDETLAKVILSSPIVQTNCCCQELQSRSLFTSLITYLFNAKCDLILNFLRTKNLCEATGFRIPNNLHLFAHVVKDLGVIQMYVSFDEKHDDWRKVSEFPFQWNGRLLPRLQFVTFDWRIYIIAINGILMRNVIAFDLKKGKEIPIAPISIYALSFIVEAQGHLYAFALFPENNPAAMQKYDAERNVWLIITPGFGGFYKQVSFNGCIYGISFSNSAEAMKIYNPVSNSWTYAIGSPLSRKLVGLAVYKSHLLLIGGTDREDNWRCDVQAYDPLTGIWSLFSPLPYTIDEIADATVLDDKMYVYNPGGQSPVFLWDEEDRVWRTLEVPPHIIQMVGNAWSTFCTLDKPEIVELVTKKNRLQGNLWERYYTSSSLTIEDS